VPVRDGDHYIVNGQKVWTSTAQQADKIVLLARTTPIEECRRPIDGLSLFYADLDRSAVEIREIEKMGRHAVNSNQLFFDNFKMPADCLIGEEGKGFRYILDSLNPERILNAAEVVGMGRRALEKGTAYANERVVFGRKIGQNQSIQHPLAECWSELYAAELMTLHAAELTIPASPAAPRRMRRNIWPPTPAFMPATAPSAPMAAWAMRRTIMSKDISARWSPCNWRRSRAK
jgi:acyl-CoA dehydrogenase